MPTPNTLSGSLARTKRKTKEVKVKRDFESISIGRDFTLQKVEVLSERVVVGKLEYIKMSLMDSLTGSLQPRNPYLIMHHRLYGFLRDGSALFS